ncbi:MAG TPA: hypothetical protein VIL26_04830 [Clostridia bacterium]
MTKKIICLLLVFVLGFFAIGCKNSGDEHGDKNANRVVPSGSMALYINKATKDSKTVYGIGTELDPHFLSQNVGLSGTTNGVEWMAKAEDWDNIFVPRIKAMNLKRIRSMILPSWYCQKEVGGASAWTKEDFESKNYNWNSNEMKSLYQVLDTAKELDISVNLTIWGVSGELYFAATNSWVSEPKSGYEKTFVTVFADLVKYLIEEKGYDNIKEVTLYNEPNSLYDKISAIMGNKMYADLCRDMHQAFIDAGIRDKVLFNLSDDARSPAWLAKTLGELYEDGIIDVANSHTYDFGDTYNVETGESLRDMTNSDIKYNLPSYNLNAYAQVMADYPDIPHMWGEFGTKNTSGSHATFDKHSGARAIDIARIVSNMFNMGSQGTSYWVLFSQYYSRNDFYIGKIMDMGLWGFADEFYNVRPVFYTYSMITRFVEAGDLIYKITSDDEDITATAFRQGDKWTYLIVNDGDESKTVSFVNDTKFPTKMEKYVFLESDIPTDNNVIPSSGTVEADGRVLTQQIPERSVIVFSSK